jgi:hypothetical protein
MAQLGRISGPLLLDNLVRDGVDLSFRNSATSPDLLKLKVNNNRVGINTDTPSFDLDVIGSTSIAGNFTATGTTATLENVVFNSNGTITTITGPLIIAPAGGANAVVFHEKVRSAQIEINDNTISNTILNQGIEIRPSGVGDVNIDASTNIYGNLYSTTDIRLDGTIRIDGSVTIIGNNPLDTIAFVPDFKQDINPGITSTFKLGDTGLRWKETHINTASGFVNTSTSNTIISNQLRITSNIISTDQSNDDVVLASNNNNVRIESFNINTSTNTISVPNNTILNFTGEGRGYIRIQGTNALRVPYGNTSQRQIVEAGATRWNTDEDWLESFDGVAWQVSTGGGRTINVIEMEEIVNKFNLILG